MNTEIDVTFDGDLRMTCTNLTNGATVHTDAPVENKGRGEYFAPSDLMAASLGACLLSLLGIVANTLGVSVEGSRARVEKIPDGTPMKKVQTINVTIDCPQSFEKNIQNSLEKSTINCPVNESLSCEVNVTFNWGVTS